MAEYNPSKIIKDGNTYNFRDTTKIPLAGSNQISGSLIPSTDNSIDIGSSTKNLKMLYTKGITINGTQFLPSDYATLSGLSTVATSGNYNDLSNKPTIPTVNNATLTIQKNGTTIDTFTANASSDKTVNIQCVDLTSNQTVGGNKEFTGTTTAHDLVPSATDTYNLGTSTNKWKTINGYDVTGIGHLGWDAIDQTGDVQTYTRTNPNVGKYAHYCVAPDNGWVSCREHNGSGTFQVCALAYNLNGDPIISSPILGQFQFGSIPVRKGEYYAIISNNESAAYTMRFLCNNG